MKKTITFFAMILLATQLIAQEQKPIQKTVSVSGSAETEVAPDEIYVQVDLREYNKKNGETWQMASTALPLNNTLSKEKILLELR